MDKIDHLYRIAEVTVEMDPRFEPLISQSRPYAWRGPERSVAKIDPSPERLRALRKKYPDSPDDLLEYMETGNAFYTLLLHFNGMMLHASAVEMQGKAYLFSAASGTGKSTHTSLWLREFGDKAAILNDDKPALRCRDGVFYAYGTPWSGKTDLNLNHKVPLQGIAFLERSRENRIRRVLSGDALPLILEQTVRPGDLAQYELLLGVLDELLKKVPVYLLSCNMEPDAARLSYRTMKEGKIDEN